MTQYIDMMRKLAARLFRFGRGRPKLPDRMAQMIADAYTACAVLEAQRSGATKTAWCGCNGFGIVSNCDFYLGELIDAGLVLVFSEQDDGRMKVEAVRL